MTIFSDFISSAWNTRKIIAGKGDNISDKAVPMIDDLIGKAVHIVGNIENFMSYYPYKLGKIG
jgi:hypothetical protein